MKGKIFNAQEVQAIPENLLKEIEVLQSQKAEIINNVFKELREARLEIASLQVENQELLVENQKLKEKLKKKI